MYKRKSYFGNCTALVLFVLCAIAFPVHPSDAASVQVLNRPLTVFGLLSQHAQYGWEDEFDTHNGINQALSTLIIEGDYRPTDILKLYGMVSLAGDLAYLINNDDSNWKRKQFDKSDELAFDDEYWQILREVHLSYTPGNSLFRVGKQIVSWGEMIGFTLLDVINPADVRRGSTDLEFEVLKVPTWMVMYEQALPISTDWISSIGIQFVYDPNADSDIYTQGGEYGNDKAGVWAAHAEAPPPYLIYPPGTLIGSRTLALDKPEEWSDARTIGFRVQAYLGQAVTTLNFLYGRDTSPLIYSAGMFNVSTVDDQPLLHFNQAGFFPIRKMVGGMFARELLFMPRIGGITSPMLRFEWAYFWDSQFVPMIGLNPKTESHDDIRGALSLELGVPIRWLNLHQMFKFNAAYSLKHITDLESGSANTIIGTMGPVQDYNHTSTFSVSTNYWASRILPSVNWFRDWTNEADTLNFRISYVPNSTWTYALGARYFYSKAGVFDHKNNVSFKIQYKFN